MIALAVGTGACGGDDNGGGDGAAGSDLAGQSGGGKSQANGGKASGGSSTADDRSGREAAIEQTLVALQDEYINAEGARYCDRLTPAGRKQVERFGKAYLLGDSCVDVINTASSRTREASVEQKPTKLISVEFKGNRAIATVRDGGRPREEMVFVNVDGDWKLPDPGFETAFGEGDARQRPIDPVELQKELQKRQAEEGSNGGR